MIEKQEEIINMIENLDDVNRFNGLKEKLNSNKTYLSLMKEFENNKEKYEKDGILKEKTLEVRKKIFEIEDLKEFLNISNNMRLLSIRISNIISDIVK